MPKSEFSFAEYFVEEYAYNLFTLHLARKKEALFARNGNP